jgi:hypothetical protein
MFQYLMTLNSKLQISRYICFRIHEVTNDASQSSAIHKKASPVIIHWVLSYRLSQDMFLYYKFYKTKTCFLSNQNLNSYGIWEYDLCTRWNFYFFRRKPPSKLTVKIYFHTNQQLQRTLNYMLVEFRKYFFIILNFVILQLCQYRKDIVPCRPVTRQRPRKKQLYNSCC